MPNFNLMASYPPTTTAASATYAAAGSLGTCLSPYCRCFFTPPDLLLPTPANPYTLNDLFYPLFVFLLTSVSYLTFRLCITCLSLNPHTWLSNHCSVIFGPRQIRHPILLCLRLFTPDSHITIALQSLPHGANALAFSTAPTLQRFYLDLRLPKLTLVWSTPLLLKLGQEPLAIDLPPAVTIP